MPEFLLLDALHLPRRAACCEKICTLRFSAGLWSNYSCFEKHHHAWTDGPMDRFTRFEFGTGTAVHPNGTREISVCPQSVFFRRRYFFHSDRFIFPAPHEMEICIRYRNANVLACHVTELRGCRVHYGNSTLQHMASAAHDLPSHVFGPENLQQVRPVELLTCSEAVAIVRHSSVTRDHVVKQIYAVVQSDVSRWRLGPWKFCLDRNSKSKNCWNL